MIRIFYLIFIYSYLLVGCNDKKLSIAALNSNGLLSPDSLNLSIFNFHPDLATFQNYALNSDMKKVITSNGYSVVNLNETHIDSSILYSFIVIKKDEFDLLARSTYVFNNSLLHSNKSVLYWVKLKYRGSGHIFFVFGIKIQMDLTEEQLGFITISLLNKIDDISGAAPVVLISDFYDINDNFSNLITNEWLLKYSFTEVNVDGKFKFFVNDFLKIKSTMNSCFADTLISNIIVKFSINTNNISRNKYGDVLPISN